MPEADAAAPPAAIREDLWFGGRLRLRQPARGHGHRAGTDALLVAAALDPGGGAHVVDLGAATGAIGLALAARAPGLRVTLAERDPALAALARENAVLNGLAARVAVATVDVLEAPARRRAAGLIPGSADAVATNPPFLDPARHRASPVAARAAAHVPPSGAATDWLATWIAAAADLLRHRGELALIHRADALAGVLAALAPRLGSPLVRPVHPRAERAATRIVVRAAKGGRAPLVLLPPLVLHDADGRFTAEAEAIHRGAALLLPA